MNDGFIKCGDPTLASGKSDCRPHEYQDSKYGSGVRVGTPLRKSAPEARQTRRCTVCGTVK